MRSHCMGKGVDCRRRADTLLKLRCAGPPKHYEDVQTQLKYLCARMLSSTRANKHGELDASAAEAPLWISSDYSGMGTVEFAAAEVEVNHLGMQSQSVCGVCSCGGYGANGTVSRRVVSQSVFGIVEWSRGREKGRTHPCRLLCRSSGAPAGAS